MTNQNPSLLHPQSIADVHPLSAVSEHPSLTDAEHPSCSDAMDQPQKVSPHELECLIQRSLQSYPGLHFARLTVHQCQQGVCLEGLLESNDDGLDLCDLVNEIAGVRALNHVVMRPVRPK